MKNPTISKYLREIGKRGGSVRSDAKANAARRNGAMSKGRPKKSDLEKRMDAYIKKHGLEVECAQSNPTAPKSTE